MKLRNVGRNVTEVTTEKGVILFSYDTPVAAYLADADNGETVVKTSTRWSVATTRHINKFFGPIEQVAERPQAFFDNLV